MWRSAARRRPRRAPRSLGRGGVARSVQLRWVMPLSPAALAYAQCPIGPRLFLAEDDDDLRTLLSSSLRKHGYEVLAAASGAELLRHLSAVAAKALPRPDAIVMDVRMPGHTGLDLLLALRLAEWDVPIVLMTAFADATLHRRATDLGAKAVLDKPLSVPDLIAAVREATLTS